MNINDNVWVRLTQFGWKEWQDYYRNLPNNPGVVPTVIIESYREPDGTFRFQLHELMLIFGQVMWHGNPQLPFVNNEIIMEKETKTESDGLFKKWWDSTNNKNWFSNKPITVEILEETARFAWRAARLW